MGTVYSMSLTRAYVIFIALVIFSMKIQAHPKISRQTYLAGSKWRPFNSNMNSLPSNERTLDMMPTYPVALQRQGFQQEENGVDPYDFVSNLRSAIQKEISVIMDIEGVYPDYSYSQKRRMQNQISALVDMLDVQPYSPSANRRFLPQQLMG